MRFDSKLYTIASSQDTDIKEIVNIAVLESCLVECDKLMVSLLHRGPDWKYHTSVYQIGPKWADRHSPRCKWHAADCRARGEGECRRGGVGFRTKPKHVNVPPSATKRTIKPAMVTMLVTNDRRKVVSLTNWSNAKSAKYPRRTEAISMNASAISVSLKKITSVSLNKRDAIRRRWCVN